ncbi:MAG: T9SS type A sorting domain-containing protein [Ignavibacteriae bacterium]|nr:T9SS type A sorting domain-containing protein [Ignavibacteriota bacterium]
MKPDNPLSVFNGENTQGWWKLNIVDQVQSNVGYLHGWGIQASPLTGIEPITGIAEKYVLSQNYPNPFNPSTKINFSIPLNGLVKLTVYDMLGKEVKTLVNGNKSAGTYSVDFNASGLPSGVYFYKLTAGEFSEVRKMMLLK